MLFRNRLFAAFAALALAAVLAAGCASYEGPDGTEASSFGQGEVTFEQERCPEPESGSLDVAPADCQTTTVTVESRGFSDVFGGMWGGAIDAAAGFFGSGHAPAPVVNVVTVPAPISVPAPVPEPR